MSLLRLILVLVIVLFAATPSFAAEGRIVKVLPHLLDLEGRHTRYPSLYERDAYQAELRRKPDQRSALRFDIQWNLHKKVAGQYKLKIEAHGSQSANTVVLESADLHKGWLESWSSITLSGEAYKKFGDLISWRASLWDGERLVAEQKSFLW